MVAQGRRHPSTGRLLALALSGMRAYLCRYPEPVADLPILLTRSALEDCLIPSPGLFGILSRGIRSLAVSSFASTVFSSSATEYVLPSLFNALEMGAHLDYSVSAH